MRWKIWETDPNRYLLRGIEIRIEIRGLAVEIQALGPHEVRTISEYEISIILGD